ncbi:MAG: estB 3 [Chthonomonadaceae bacterium]|nr:estB 3 [Chthonomonadaceae bacterium]
MKSDLCLHVPLLLAALASLYGAMLPARAEEKTSSSKIATALQPFVDSHSLAGAVTLVADKDTILGLEAIGYADVAAHKAMATDDLFWIASQSKPITATCLMMLVDEGKLKLDDPVAKYLPEFHDLWLATEHDDDHMTLKRPRHPITVREILSHTSGMSFSSAMEQPTLDVLPLRDGVRSYAMTPLQYEPGTKYQYANAGINTAGRLIEVLSGMPYAEFLNTRLFKPLGMKDTTFWPTKAQLTRLAKSYRPNDAKTDLEETTVTQLRYPLDDRTRQPMPAGGLFSTAADLARFCRMILNKGTFKGKRYLSEEAVHQMTSKQTGDAVPDGYGLGWSTGGGNFGHGGAYSTNMNIDTNRGLITIWMVQHAGFPGNGDQSAGAFRKAAEDQFGNTHK